MLLDNKTKIEDNEYCKVFEYIKNYSGNGLFDLVSGFFSVNALAWLNDDVNKAERYRMILGKIITDDSQLNQVIDLLNGDNGIDSTLSLSASAHKAVAFLQQSKVFVKNIQKNFCHAKTYIYRDEKQKNSFYIVGSSNLTDAGLGLKESGNIELNTADTGGDNDFKELRAWFNTQWDKVADNKIVLPDKSKIEVKDYIIKLIKELYRPYTPKELYYKVLYELFKDDLETLTKDTEFNREIAHLKDTVIYHQLYPYQQKGVISLIKMLQKYNGAILADAVGLGKTWTALAVMKYFEIKGYTVLLLCPKKLRFNWEQYKAGNNSRFEKDDIEYYIRYHTDLQEGLLDRTFYDKKLGYFKKRQKILVVIDESHNLRNDKSSRYEFLVNNILLPKNANRDVKVLHLSATPINNKLIDIRNQFKLMVKGNDWGFEKTPLEINSLESIFRTAQKDFNDWSEIPDRKISGFIEKLPPKFFELTDALIVARTRKLIEGEYGSLNFPVKEKPPVNEYISPENIGNYKSFDEILTALKINLTAYRPSEYITDKEVESAIENPKLREKYLVKMMYILLVKRLESSWSSFKSTLLNILNHHENALTKVNLFIEQKKESELEDDLTPEEQEDLEETAAEIDGEAEPEPITLGKKNPVPLSSITNIELFKKHLEWDINRLKLIKENLELFEANIKNKKSEDEKLIKLIAHIEEKQKHPHNKGNKKVLIFTVFKDTAEYLYTQLIEKKIKNLAYISGSLSQTSYGYSGKKFENILEKFAPFTKLFKEKDWSNMEGSEFLKSPEFKSLSDIEQFEKWKNWISKIDSEIKEKLENPIDVLIATDCLSEGQNLQDCDCLINYDIHWNPVRLIQRMGRIDRLGSPNKTIKGINFWAGKNYEDYLKLKSRVENRMALMSVVGTELDENLSPEFQEIVKENPLLPKQAEKMLEQLQITWDDVETNDETLGLNDLSLEQFRQELYAYFKEKEDFFKNIPNGVFTGFKFIPNKKWDELPNSIVAVLGYPCKQDENTNHIYKEIHLLHQPIKGANKSVRSNSIILKNNQEILTLLRLHREEKRYVPDDIENCDRDGLNGLSQSINDWLKAQAPVFAVSQIQGLFEGTTEPQKLSSEDKKLEEKFRKENFDLINWFIISNK